MIFQLVERNPNYPSYRWALKSRIDLRVRRGQKRHFCALDFYIRSSLSVCTAVENLLIDKNNWQWNRKEPDCIMLDREKGHSN